jgi:hypothetical protein
MKKKTVTIALQQLLDATNKLDFSFTKAQNLDASDNLMYAQDAAREILKRLSLRDNQKSKCKKKVK